MKIRNVYPVPDVVNGYPIDFEDGGWFSVLVPVAITSINTNPSFEIDTTGYTAVNSTLLRVATYQRRGVYSGKVTPSSSALAGCYLALTTATDGQYSCGVDIYDSAGRWFDLYFANSSGTRVSRVASIRGANYWKRIWVNFAEYSGGSRRVYIVQRTGGSTTPFYIDGVLVLPTKDKFAYFDGDKKGFLVGTNPFYWSGTPHASTCSQILDTGAGGNEMKLLDLGFKLLAVVGLGLQSFTGLATPISDGGAQYQRSVAVERQFSLVGSIMGDSLQEIQRTRANLAAYLSPQRTATPQEMVLRYHRVDPNTGEESECLDIPCVLDGNGGLGGSLDNFHQERVELVFKQFMPAIYADGEQGAEIGYWSVLSGAQNIVYRSGSGVWSALSTGADQPVQALKFGYDGMLYAGGDFLHLGGVTAYYVGRWDGTTWAALDFGMDASVTSLAIGPDGTLYAGGNFTHVGAGSLATNYVAKYSAGAWSALGTGIGAGALNTVKALAIGPDGALYVAGLFSTAGGVTVNNIAKWNGTSWSALGTGTNDLVNALAFAPDGSLYAAGAFTSAGGTAANFIAKWDGSAWTALGTGTSSTVSALAIGPDGALYAAGGFPTAGGVTVNNIARWNGTSWSALGSGLNNSVNTLTFGSDGSLYIGGAFTGGSVDPLTGKGIVFFDRVARYQNGAYAPIPLNVMDGAAYMNAIAINPLDQSMAFGGNWSGSTALVANTNSVVNGGARSYPTLTFTGPGELYYIANGNQEIDFNELSFAAGEKAVLTTDPMSSSFVSSSRGDLTNYILGQSTSISLEPGTNLVSLLLNPTPTETGDNNNQLSTYNLAGITASNSDGGKLYVSITYSAPNYRIRIYKDAARTQEVANSANYTTTGVKTISEANSSGISGEITVTATTAADADIVVTFPTANVRWVPVYSSIDGATR